MAQLPTKCISNGGARFKFVIWFSNYVWLHGTVTRILHPPLLMHKRWQQLGRLRETETCKPTKFGRQKNKSGSLFGEFLHTLDLQSVDYGEK